MKIKIIVYILVAIILLLIGRLAYIGNYFFDYALVRQEGIVTLSSIDLNAPKSIETDAEIINMNIVKIKSFHRQKVFKEKFF